MRMTCLGNIFLTGRLQLTRNDPSVSKAMNGAAFALMVYGVCVCVFWYVYHFFFDAKDSQELLVWASTSTISYLERT